MKILHTDIETSPNIVLTWGLFNQNIPPACVIEPSKIICWGAKWHGQKKVFFNSIHESKEKDMIKEIHGLFDEADLVVTYNGKSFDVPKLNQQFAKFGLKPPAPFKQADLYRVVTSNFDLPSNKLEFVAPYFGLGNKVKHEGIELWKACMAGDKQAWKRMKTYNIGDVTLLESLYTFLLPWINGHPNHALYDGSPRCCTNCGSTKIQSRGVDRSSVAIYQRYKCMDCGKWMKERRRTEGTPDSLRG